MKVSALDEINRALYEGEIIIYGCGKAAIEVYKKLIKNHMPVAAFTATNVREGMKSFCGKPIWDLGEVADRYREKHCQIVIGTVNRKFIDEIIANLEVHGIRDHIYTMVPNYKQGLFDTSKMAVDIAENIQKINYVRSKLCDDVSREVFDNMLNLRKTNDMEWAQKSNSHDHICYFPPEIVISDEEVFVDGGGYDADTIEEFIKACSSKYKHIYSFEPDDLLFPILKEVVNNIGYSNITLCPMGLYQEKTVLKFDNRHTQGSSISDNGELEIPVIDLDTFFEKEPVTPTFIKMDIEGAERDALKGCKRLIKNYFPKLAICIYHLPDDLWEIPYWLMINFPEYQYYIRHYRDNATETLLYAVP